MRKILLASSALIAFLCAALGAGYFDAFVLEPNWLKIERVTVVRPALAAALGPLTIAQVSDLHIRSAPGFIESRLSRALARLKPDVVFFTGDLVSRRPALAKFWAFARTVTPRLWSYAIPGDDDEGLINDRWRDPGWRRAGIALLVNEIVRIRWPGAGKRGLWLIGAGPDFPWGSVREKVPEGEPVIVLAHRPAEVKQAAIVGADMVFAGDTHGGQIGAPALHRFSSYARRGPYTAGLYRVRGTLLYVNRGTGWKARPMRFFCRPELTVFRVVPSGEMRNLKVLPGDE
jgi:predicted MPP superfamily phosphohydrolase